ncbi:MAG: hypothetical protein C4558_08915 [Dehalococcoidia bacterium]|nr:MAG: hypothetical protein C4558_08915 [Dehalococcoidia bacterium]
MWRRPVEPSVLAEIVPPRALEESMSAARGLIATLASDAVSLEIAVTDGGPRWYLRTDSEPDLDRAIAQVRIAYPQCAVEHVALEEDPAQVRADEHAAAVALQARAEDILPLRTDWRHERDPLTGVLTAAAAAGQDRVVVRLSLTPAPERASDQIRRRAEPSRSTRVDSYERTGPSPVPLLVLLSAGAGVLQGWRWYESGEWMSLALSTGGALAASVLAAAIWTRFLRRPDPLPNMVVERKLSGPLLTARLDVYAFGTERARVEAAVAQIAAAFVAYDDPAGGGVRGRRPQRFERRTLGGSLCLNAAEAAALWHLPEENAAPARVRRTTARRLAPAPGHAARGVRVGVGDANDDTVAVYLPVPLVHRNHLIVAKTRRGKSTLLRHLAGGVMERVADGADDTALVVVDPHQDLAEAVLGSIPEALIERTVYLDFANLDRPVGLNLIDVALFPDRDRTTEHIVTMLNRLWPANWGPRMEGALRAALATLHELNGKRARDEQYTLLDVAPLLTDEKLRKHLLQDVDDPALAAWWRDNYDRAGRTLQQQTANPVTSKIGRFTVTEASRLVLGQAQSTFDPRALLRDGGVLVVNTAVGALGEGAASLVGATLLNLLGLLVEEQVAIPAAERRRVVQLVDESSTLGAVDYPRMLSELGKYGASFVLVTQSLAKLDAIDRNLAPTIFANSDGLTAFQVSAEDARRLTPELGGGIEVEDLVSLDDFTCYARWWDGRARPAAFSFRVDPPPPDATDRARAIARASAAKHGRPRDEVVEEVMRALAERSPALEPRATAPGPATGARVHQDAAARPTDRVNAALDVPVAPAPGRGNSQRAKRPPSTEARE